MSLEPTEFIRRFLKHVLPRGFVRIRYYGLLANRTRMANVERTRDLLKTQPPPEPRIDREPWEDFLHRARGVIRLDGSGLGHHRRDLLLRRLGRGLELLPETDGEWIRVDIGRAGLDAVEDRAGDLRW